MKTKVNHQLEEELREALADEMGIESIDIAANSSLTEDLGLTSLDMVELIMIFEDKHKVQVDDDKLDDIKTFADLVTVLSGVK